MRFFKKNYFGNDWQTLNYRSKYPLFFLHGIAYHVQVPKWDLSCLQ
jgi:hypothetical protein